MLYLISRYTSNSIEVFLASSSLEFPQSFKTHREGWNFQNLIVFWCYREHWVNIYKMPKRIFFLQVPSTLHNSLFECQHQLAAGNPHAFLMSHCNLGNAGESERTSTLYCLIDCKPLTHYFDDVRGILILITQKVTQQVTTSNRLEVYSVYLKIIQMYLLVCGVSIGALENAYTYYRHT